MLKHHVVRPEIHNPLTWESVETIIDAKCRKCEHCLRKRRQHWWFRAKWEIEQAPRTWFATFTYSPDNHYRMLLMARQRCLRKGVDYDALTDDQQLGHLVAIAGVDLTLFFKRVRKSSMAPLRYLIVSETHKSGLPHFHALIHETIMRATTYDVLKRNWLKGHSAFKLAEPKAVSYVAKYISKESGSRVRASAQYGSATTAYAKAASEALAERSRRGEIVTGKGTGPSTVKLDVTNKGSQ